MNEPAKAGRRGQGRASRRPRRGAPRSRLSPSIPARSQRSSRRRHGDPFAVLGPHEVGPASGRSAPCCRERPRSRAVRRQGGDLALRLKRVDPAGFFCGRVASVHRPYYKLEIDWPRRNARRVGPLSLRTGACLRRFLAPSRDVGSDALLQCPRRAHGEHRRRRRASASPSGRRTPARSASSATSTTGTAAAIRCGCATSAASGSCSFPSVRAGAALQVRDRAAPTARLLPLKADPVAFAAEHPPATASRRARPAADPNGPTATGWTRAAAATRAASADLDLRVPSRLLGARARGGQPLSHLPRARPSG